MPEEFEENPQPPEPDFLREARERIEKQNKERLPTKIIDKNYIFKIEIKVPQTRDPDEIIKLRHQEGHSLNVTSSETVRVSRKFEELTRWRTKMYNRSSFLFYPYKSELLEDAIAKGDLSDFIKEISLQMGMVAEELKKGYWYAYKLFSVGQQEYLK
jgi:hypothetical protein